MAIDFSKATGTQAWAMNPMGDIIGSYTLSDKSTHGFLISGDRYITIDFPGATSTVPGAINSRGDIAGPYTLRDNSTPGFVFSQDAINRLVSKVNRGFIDRMLWVPLSLRFTIH